jgi:hypothetical protein
MNYCYNSAAADRYADEMGRESEREIWLESKRADIEAMLDAGLSVGTGSAFYTKAEILSEEMHELAAFIMIANGHWSELAALRDEIVEKWLDKNLVAIAAAEYGLVDYYGDAA